MPNTRRATTVAAMVAIPLLAVAPLAAAAPVKVNYACQASTPLGDKPFTLAQDVEVTAPATVAPDGALTVVYDPAGSTIPAEVEGFKIKRLEKVALRIPVPANSTFVSAERSGGSGVGETDFAVKDGVGTLTATGPIPGGGEYELPTVTVVLKAAESGTIKTRVYGTSHDDPGLTLTSVVKSTLGDINVPTACYPNPSPVFTTTTIG